MSQPALAPIVGLHHVTAIASDPQRNLDFYTDVLGLRLVKRTINFDDPGTYHLYFGDDAGSPGTILTFFPWPHAARGTRGAGETIATTFAMPADSLGYWQQRLARLGVGFGRAQHLGENLLSLEDPDGMQLEIVGSSQLSAGLSSRLSDVPPEHALRGFAGTTLLVREAEPTGSVLTAMGFVQTGEEVAEQRTRLRYVSTADTDMPALGSRIDVVVDPKAQGGRMGAGTVHHIAFRAPDDAAQRAWRTRLEEFPLSVTHVLDRTYFHSIYFREPGGVLFELATDPPGFTSDEPLASLGESLRLPPWLEPRRASLERILPPLTLRRARDTEAAE